MTSIPITPTAEEVEAVARAICIARGTNPDEANYAITDFNDNGPQPDIACPAWRWHRDSARAAILALDTLRSQRKD